MTKLPHGLLGKAYAATALIAASMIMTAVAIAIIIAPFWLIASVFAVLVILGIGLVVRLAIAQPSGGG